jgi:hypothetical protein
VSKSDCTKYQENLQFNSGRKKTKLLDLFLGVLFPRLKECNSCSFYSGKVKAVEQNELD